MANDIPSKRKFYIFGHNISHSLSPTLHNAGFQALDLPYHYSIHQSEKVDKSVEDLMRNANFGGASVTYPHKLHIGKLVDAVVPRAEKMGAINTITVKQTSEGRALVGDNSDWAGIKACIEKSDIQDLNRTPGLIIGAGGAARAACYAMETLGIKKIIIVNRTKPNFEAIAACFPSIEFQLFYNLEDFCDSANWKECRVVVACIPADDLVADKIPSGLFSNSEDGVLVEMAYRPPVTGMMKVAARYDGWKVYRGVDVLEEQAYVQFELWTGKPAPMPVMREAMMSVLRGRL